MISIQQYIFEARDQKAFWCGNGGEEEEFVNGGTLDLAQKEIQKKKRNAKKKNANGKTLHLQNGLVREGKGMVGGV